jgi:hypothetical protein
LCNIAAFIAAKYYFIENLGLKIINENAPIENSYLNEYFANLDFKIELNS